MDAEGFIRDHVQQLVRAHPMPEFLSMPYHENAEIKQNLDTLPQELKSLFHKLFNSDKSKISLKEVLPFKAKKGSVPYCHCMLTPKIECYRCFDCQIHPDSLFCEDCFKRGNHEGHRYVQLREEGDCDCGNKTLIKEIGFCPQHCGAEEIIEINSSEEFIFNLYVRQLFIWILKLIKVESRDGEVLLLYFLAYLAEINDLSPYYNRLTTRALFAEVDPIADHIFYISLNGTERGKLVQAVINLFFKMLVLREFKERLLISLIINYNKIESFETSKYVRLFYPLLNEPQVVIAAMGNYPIALRPERPFNVVAFYKDLSIIKDIAPAAAQAFLKPLLLVDTIIFPFLKRVEERCEKMNNLIVTVFPEFQKEEFMYYKLLVDIIRVIEDKEVLAAMISNYCKVILEYSFKKNKIILVPQRVLVLLIYKYFDCDLQKVDADEVRKILNLEEDVFHEQIHNNWVKFAECLFEFSTNLNRTNYFDNYINLYAKEKGQIICIDYMGFKIMAALSKHRKDSFQSVLEQIFRVDNERLNRDSEQKSDLVKSGNIFLKILIEIVYSPRTEFIINALLGRKNPNFSNFLKGLCHSTGELTIQQLQNIGQLFQFAELERDIIENAVIFDSARRKYIPRVGEEPEEINLQFFISLLQTKFSKFIQKKGQSDRYLQLNESQQQLKEALLNCNLLYTVAMKQMKFIQGHPDDKNLIRELIRVFKTIKLAYGRQQKQYDGLLAAILKQIKQKFIIAQSPECLNRLFLQEIERELTSSARTVQIQQTNDKETLKRKELLRLKKEKVMKAKKIKENQQKFLEPEKKQQEEMQTEEMCLICRENKDLDQICYVGKMRFTSLLHDFMETRGDNVIFKSCFHTVHFDCFMRMEKTNQAASCPLCKCAINIVLPLEDSYRFALMEKISSRIEHVLNFFIINNQCKEKRGFILEVILYFAYLFAVNISDLGQIGERQMKLCKIIYSLADHNMSFEDRQERAETYFEYLTNKLKRQQNVFVYRDLVNLMQSLIFWNANNDNDIDYPYECIESLSFHFSMPKILQVLKMMNRIMSSPEVSALEPIIIASEQASVKISQQSEGLTFINFWKLPEDLNGLLRVRDRYGTLCKTGHQICVCLICHMPSCLTCKKTTEHVTQKHPRECLMFNTCGGGILYYFHGLEVGIRCLYTNDIGKIWKPELKVEGFHLDRKLYDEILQELKGGSLFNYLITTFQGLKGNNIADRI